MTFLRAVVRRRSPVRFPLAAVCAAPALLSVAPAAPLDPNSFTSLGTLNPSAGTYTANTSGTPTLVVGGTTFTGVVQPQGAGLPDIAVFTFNSVTVGNGVTINGSGSRPLAILSKGNVTFAGSGSISVAGGGAGGGPSPDAGPGGGGTTGAGGGGGGFGGNGGKGGSAAITGQQGGAGGVAYGNLTNALQGGSGGGIGSAAAGGAGGGGLEIGAVGTLSMASTTVLDARGGAGVNTGSALLTTGGGGSGGGLLLHAASYNLPGGGALRAAGGAGGVASGTAGGGGGGGGGRIAVVAGSYVTGSSVVSAFADVAGGSGGSGGAAGTAGVAQFTATTTTVSTGSSFDFLRSEGYTSYVTHDLVVQSGGIASKVGGYVNNGVVTVQSGGVFTATGQMAGGTWNVQGGVLSAAGGFDLSDADLIGTGTAIGAVSGTSGMIQAVGGTLTIGDANSTQGFNYNGVLQAGSAFSASPGHLVLLDADRALIGTTTLFNDGSLLAANGTTLRSGATLTAGNNTFLDGVFTNNGIVKGPSTAGQFLTFTDDVNGAGSYTGNVKFSDGFSPGNSPAAVSFGNVAFDATADLLIELGGLVAGSQFDMLSVAGDALLGGDLVVSLINGFTPQAGDQFLFLDIAGVRTGTFAGLNEGALVGNFGGQDLFITYTAGNGNDVALVAGQGAAVPEPSSMMLLALAGVGGGGWRVWRRRKGATKCGRSRVPA